jgi:DNA-binding CsgD family transcriptional regulator
MDYKRHYDKLIETRIDRKWQIGLEIHHMVPKSMGGSNNKENLVNLTPREHFLAHWLLWKIHRNRQMSMAFFSMCQYRKGERKNFKISSRSYEEARLSRIITGISEETKEKMSKAKKGKIYSLKTREKMSLAKIGKEPWNKGLIGISDATRNIMSEKAKKRRKRDLTFFKIALENDIKITDKQKNILTKYLTGENLSEIADSLNIKLYEINNCLRSISTKIKKNSTPYHTQRKK